MGRRKRTEFEESLRMNNYTWRQYYDRLMQLSMVMFKYDNLPDTIDPRFLEKTLFNRGNCLFFEDEVLGYLTLPSANLGKFDVYDVPRLRRAYATNGYQNQLDGKDSVIIWNNMLSLEQTVDLMLKCLRRSCII